MQFAQRIFAVERHELVAQFVGDGVQRDRQHGADLLAGARDVRHHARRRQRDAPLGNAEALAVGDDVEAVAHGLEIVQRLAHAHHDDVGDEALFSPSPRRRRRALPIVEPVARQHHLADDLARREIAHQALRAGMAERAIERAADLARNAQRAAIGFRNVDALDLMRPAVGLAGQPEQPFARAVDRNLLGGDFRPRQREVLRQLRAQLLRQGRHVVEVLRAAHIKPVPNLLRAHAALPLRHADARRALRRARRATGRRATASPARHSARAAASR